MFRSHYWPIVMWSAISSGGMLLTPGKAGKRASHIHYIRGASGVSHYHADVLVDSKVYASTGGRKGGLIRGCNSTSDAMVARGRFTF